MASIRYEIGGFLSNLINLRSWVSSQLNQIRSASGLITAQLRAGLILVLIFGLVNLALVAILDFGFEGLKLGAGETLLYSVALTSLSLGGPALLMNPTGAMPESLTTIYPAPTLFLVALLLVSIRRGAISARFSTEGKSASKREIVLGVASWSLTIYGSLLALTFAANMSPAITMPKLSIADARVLPVVLAVTALPAALSAINKRNVSLGRASSMSNWLTALLAIWLKAQAVLVAIGLAAVVIFLVIDVTFAPSKAIVAPPQPELFVVISGVVFLIAISPLLLAATFFASSGIPVGSHFDQLTSSLLSNGLSALDPIVGTEVVSAIEGFLEFSIYGSLGQVWLIVPALVSALTALIAGAAASVKTGWSSSRLALPVAGLGTSLLLVLIATFSSIRTDSSNGGVSASTALPGQLVLEETWFSWGPSLLGTLVLAVWIGIFASLGATKSFKLISNSFTRSVARLSKSKSFKESFAKRSISGHVVGKVTVAVIALSMVVPITLVSVERGWATADGGQQSLEKIADQIVNAPLDELKEIIASNPAAQNEWLNDDALLKARPTSENVLKIEALNANGDAFQIGNTDLVGKLSWDSDPRLSVKVTDEAEVTEEFWLIQHAIYKPVIPYLSLEILPSKYHIGSTAQISVNGQLLSMENSTYSVVPGVYKIVVPQYKLVAASDKTVAIGAAPVQFEMPAEVALPTGADANLTAALDAKVKECSEVDENGQSTCFAAKSAESKTTAGTVPEEFFEYEDSTYKYLKSECSTSVTDVLRSASAMRREANCEWQVGYKRTFYDFKMQTVATYRTETEYYFCSDDWWDYSICERTVKVKTGEKSVKVRGNKISTLDYVATVEKKVMINAEMDSNGTFKVTGTQLAS